MTRPLMTAVLLLAVSPAGLPAQEALPWTPAENKPNVTLHPAGKLAKGPVLEVTGTADEKSNTNILVLDQPKVPSHHYVLRGRVKYEGVQGIGFLEMLTTFPKRGTFFTRTLAEAGTLARLEGTGDWRDVELPFKSEPNLLPEKLVVNVVLPGKGKVYLTPFTLEEWQAAGTMAAAPGEWWPARTGGWFGGLLGGSVGLLGAAVGFLGGFGVARRLTLALVVLGVVIGVLALLAGFAALAQGQPYHVYYPLLLVGAIAALVFGVNLPVLKKRYDQIELRRMAAMDA